MFILLASCYVVGVTTFFLGFLVGGGVAREGVAPAIFWPMVIFILVPGMKLLVLCLTPVGVLVRHSRKSSLVRIRTMDGISHDARLAFDRKPVDRAHLVHPSEQKARVGVWAMVPVLVPILLSHRASPWAGGRIGHGDDKGRIGLYRSFRCGNVRLVWLRKIVGTLTIPDVAT